ncbi:hypothetical protein PSHT_08247, partial [Puccinia striiformis]
MLMANPTEELDGGFQRHPLKDIGYGSIAGICSKLFEHPFDLVKVRLQSQPLHLPSRYNGPVDCFRQTVGHEGFRGLYRGVSMPVVGAMAENATLFLVYGQVQQLIRRLAFPDQVIERRPPPLPLGYLSIAAACGGAMASLILTPIELVKCKMQVQQIAADPTNNKVGPLGIVRSVLKRDGFAGLWLGQTGTLLRETGGAAIWFCTFESIVALFVKRHQEQQQQSTGLPNNRVLSKDDLSSPELMISGGIAGILYNLVFFPADSIKSTIQTASELIPTSTSQTPTNNGFLNVGRQIVQNRGWKGLYAGCGITCLRSAPSSALIFWITKMATGRWTARRLNLSINRQHNLRPKNTAAYSTIKTEETRISRLPNGIRVTTEPTPGHFIGAGVYVDAGSRYESDYLRGSTHLTDRMAFKSTQNRTTEQISLEIEQLGGSFFASSGRDTVLYQATSYPDSLSSVLSVLSDTALNPVLKESELLVEQQAAEWEVNEINKKPEYMIPEILHETAFPKNTLGLPLICPKDRIHSITPEVLWSYRSLFFKPERIVVAGVGVDHDTFLAHAEKYFGDFKSVTPTVPLNNNHITASFTPTASSTNPILGSTQSTKSMLSKAFATTTNISPLDLTTGAPLQSFEELINAKPIYKGGEVRIPGKMEGNLAHIYIGFEAPSVHDEDLYAIACTHIMLGGGSSFSAGGPGKGMYSRLYTNVLNPHPEVDFCQAFHHTYSDAGLFGIAIAVQPEFANQVPQIIATQLDLISRDQNRGGITEAQLRRAKNQLRSTMMYGLESRLLQVEDLGRQVQTAGRKKPWSEVWERIESLTIKDIHQAISKIIRPGTKRSSSSTPNLKEFSGVPTIVATGQIDRLGDIQDLLKRYGIGHSQPKSNRL